jgi:putative ABC transport system ATP-binding protein
MQDQGTTASQSNEERVAAYQFQRGPAQSVDPLAEAIQNELGARFAPGALSDQPVLTNDIPVTSDEVFRAVNLTKAYGEGVAYIEVIKGITFNVRQGEYVIIFGPSGSGKSTLLHLLAGLEVPSRGEIRIRNIPIQSFNDDDLAMYHREQIGLVFQSFNLLDSITAWENVAFPLMLAGAPQEWRRHESYKMLGRFGLAEFADHYPAQLSGGQQQRVSLARALVHDPELLLIDEPTGNLDSRSAQIVMDEIERLHKQEHRTIILVTHNQEFLRYADRIFYIRDGTLLTAEAAAHADRKEQESHV